MTFVPSRRSSLLLKTGVDERHLYFVLTDPHGDPRAVLIVNASSVPRKHVPYDATCILGPRDHKFLDRPSYMAYQFAEIITVDKVARGVLTGDMKPMGAISEQCCARICAGLLSSRALPFKCKDFYLRTTGIKG